MKTNPLYDDEFRWSSIDMTSALCLHSNCWKHLQIMMEVLLMIIVISLTRLYVNDQTENAVKSGRLPTDFTWMALGVFANIWCCCLTVLAIPLLFWSEDTPTNTVLDCMTLLFVSKLDDFSDSLGANFIRLSDADFQRIAAWSAALLSQCPVRVADLINPSAKDIRDLWQIEFADGMLMAARSDGGPARACETRMGLAQPTERCSLLAPSPTTTHDTPLKYYAPSFFSHHGYIELPTWSHILINGAWYILGLLLGILHVALPIGFVTLHQCT
jgi:hypothetical protein